MLLKISGIDYGLSLYYSYLLPMFDVKPVERGFIFRKVIGFCSGIECKFDRTTLKTICTIPNSCQNHYTDILGLSTNQCFKDLCKLYGNEKCIASKITLLYSPTDARNILYAILLSRNTDYFINTLKWFREFIYNGTVRSRSYVVKQFLEIKDRIEEIFTNFKNNIQQLIAELLSTKYVGLKTVSALLLHAYGLTEHAPVDRHYLIYLSKIFQWFKPGTGRKSICISNMLNCLMCKYRERCIYGVTKIFGKLNGCIQSIAYLSKRLAFIRNDLEEILVPKEQRDIKALERIVSMVIQKIVGDAQKNAGL